MKGSLTLGIDIGTGSAKGVLIDIDGQVFASASRSYRYSSLTPGSAEQAPQTWWKALCEVTRELISLHPEARERLCAIGVCGQGVAAVVLGHDRKPLRNAILWMDTRCSQIAAEICRSHGEALAQISGKLPATYNFEPKLLWLREHEGFLWDKIWKAMTTTAYINLRLTGEAVMNHSDAGILLSYDLTHRRWSSNALELLDLPISILCDLQACHEVIGGITVEGAAETGLPRGLPVIAGGEDTSCAGLAMGVASELEVQISMGSASTVNIPFSRPISDSRLLAFPHVIEGLTLVGGSMASGGLAVEWMLQLLGDSDTEKQADLLEDLTRRASELPPGGNGLIFLPYLNGELQPINDGFARGVFFGLSMADTREHLFRAVIEGTVFAIQHTLTIAYQAGASPNQLIAVGGPTRSDLWCQIVTDVTGLPLRVMEDKGGAALGAAILAGMGVRLFDDPLQMQKVHARIRKQFTPNTFAHARYQKLFSVYREMYPRLQDLFPRLSSE